jgi:hypothetical protein
MRSIAILVLAISSGCTILEPKRDGEACERHDECESETCAGGICAFSSCEHQSHCAGGFTCDEPPDWLEVLSFGIARGVCQPSCDVCPHGSEPRWVCDAPSNGCFYDAEPWIEVGGPYEAIVGEPVTLAGSVEFADGRSLSEARWQLYDTELGQGLEIEAVFEMPGLQRVSLVVIDDDNHAAIADADVQVCSDEAGPCSVLGDCCGDLECRDDDEDGAYACEQLPTCGDGIIEGAEECDGALVPDTDCTDLGQNHPGEVPCTEDCRADAAACEACGQTWDSCTTHADCCDGFMCDEFFGDCMPP